MHVIVGAPVSNMNIWSLVPKSENIKGSPVWEVVEGVLFGSLLICYLFFGEKTEFDAWV